MKISRNELRRMILESVLKEQEDIAAAKAREAVKAAIDVVNTRENERVKNLPKSAPDPEKIKEIQKFLNHFLDEVNKDKVSVDGKWSKDLDRGLKEVFEHLNIQKPQRKWAEVAKEYGYTPNLTGLVEFLDDAYKKDKEIDTSKRTSISDKVKNITSNLGTPIAGSVAGSTKSAAIKAALDGKQQTYFVSSNGKITIINSDGKEENPSSSSVLNLKGVEDKSRIHYEKEFPYKDIYKAVQNESFGKSHATLIRERYWGRY